MIKLIKGYPYDNSYDYIKLYKTKEEQNSFFNSFNSITVDEGEEEGYIREGKSFIVDFNYDYLVSEGVNYVIWNNGYKDLYCFIISKEYVDEEMTRLYYEIDVLNTYLFDFTLNTSFVERKNCSIDEITDYDEGLEIGEHTIIEEHTVFNKDSVYFAMFNGIKEQQIIFSDEGKVQNIIDVPYPTAKPLTIVDNIAYPLYFMPLLEQDQYSLAIKDTIKPPNNINQSKVVTSALKCLGMRYVWGGNLPPFGTDDGTDCSGLCQWAFYDSGLFAKVNLGGRWTTYTMYPHSEDVSIYNLSSGDVMFCSWGTSEMQSISTWTNGLPSHVAIVESINRDTEGNYIINTVEALSEHYPITRRSYKYNENKMKFGRMLK